jgi:hypothetical protein
VVRIGVFSAYLVPRMEYDFDAVEEEDSPYPEVRASVSNVDDPEMPARAFIFRPAFYALD